MSNVGPWVVGPRAASTYSEAINAMGMQARMQPIGHAIKDRINAELDIGVKGEDITAGLAGFVAGVLLNIARNMPADRRVLWLQSVAETIAECVELGIEQEGWGQ